jgi:transcription elongation GreA/GreB family factor
MSVAFRRESDEAHLEPRFELPIPPGPNLVTRRGLAQIESEVARLEALVGGAGAAEGQPRPNATDISAPADPATDAARRELRYWRARLATAQPAPAPEPDLVGFGTRVTVKMAGRTRVIEIVGADEADPTVDRLAFTAPLAQALIGGEPGEWLDFAGKAEAIEILAVAPLE